MKKTIKAAALGVAAALALTACGGGSSSSSSDNISVVGYSVLSTADKPVFAAFQKTSEGKGVTFTTSYGASGDQSRAVEAGQKADLVHFSLEPDITRLVGDKLVSSDWNTTPTKGIVADSVVAIVTRKGNPLGIKGWDDLIKPGVKIVTPNPASSGSAKWNILAVYGHVLATGGTPAQAEAFTKKFLANVVALPDSGRDATTAFTSGTGDVLLSYENEAILAKASGADLDYFIPDDTLLIETPAAVTTDASAKAKDFLTFLTTPAAQALYAESGFRPVVSGVTLPKVEGANDPSNPFPTPKTLETIDKTFGGWDSANDKFFADTTGIITKLLAEKGTTQ